ncbi:MAG TPA: hypothetical protein VIF62_38240 [Labilithrix sp.]
MQRLAAIAFSLLASGCLATQTKTLVEVRDTSQVALVAGDARLEPGRTQADVVLSHGAFPTEAGARARYTLHAVRNDDGSIAFVWETRAPILNGDDQLVIGPDGALAIGDPSVVRPGTLASPSLELHSCASLTSTHARNVFVGWRAHEWDGCGGTLAVPYALETSWSNVVRVRQTIEPYRGAAAVGIVISTLIFGGLGALFLSLPCKSQSGGSDCTSVLHAVGWTTIGIGAFFDVLMLPTLVAPTRETISYPP